LSLDAVRLRIRALMAGMVVAAPMPMNVKAIARRLSAGIRSASSNPRPKPSAARVPTMKPKSGGVSVNVVCTGTSTQIQSKARAGTAPDRWCVEFDPNVLTHQNHECDGDALPSARRKPCSERIAG